MPSTKKLTEFTFSRFFFGLVFLLFLFPTAFNATVEFVVAFDGVSGSLVNDFVAVFAMRMVF